jgi:hypothetical protein
LGVGWEVPNALSVWDGFGLVLGHSIGKRMGGGRGLLGVRLERSQETLVREALGSSLEAALGSHVGVLGVMLGFRLGSSHCTVRMGWTSQGPISLRRFSEGAIDESKDARPEPACNRRLAHYCPSCLPFRSSCLRRCRHPHGKHIGGRRGLLTRGHPIGVRLGRFQEIVVRELLGDVWEHPVGAIWEY